MRQLLWLYPLHPLRTAPLAHYALHLLQWKGAKTAAFVHDLDSLRQPGDSSARWSDQELLPGFDRVIIHNDRMADYIAGQGVKAENLLPLSLFDWRTNEPIPERTLSADVCVAGNLTRKRSRYLHDLPRKKVHWHLCGEGWKGKNKRDDITWHGGKMTALTGSFGLVWAGMSTRVCTGSQGAYMMLASPRAASLYLAQGMPLIVWKWAALADFVRENKLGLVVDAIDDIPAAIAAMTAEEYADMAANARVWGEKLRRGDMTRAVLERLG